MEVLASGGVVAKTVSEIIATKFGFVKMAEVDFRAQFIFSVREKAVISEFALGK